MSTPILILKSQNVDAGLTTFMLDTSYVDSFTNHLRNNAIEFTVSEALTSEWGLDTNKERWEFLAKEILVRNLHEIPHLLQSWASQFSKPLH
jgi:hypothetical protein